MCGGADPVLPLTPSPSRCKITGRQCEGYVENEPEASESDRSTTDGRARSPLPVRPTQIPTIKLDTEDSRFFELYHSSAVPTISGHTPMSTWKVLIPQLCMTEPAVANAVLAISALHEEAEIKRTPLQLIASGHEISPSQTYALNHYGKALKELQIHLERPNASPTVILACCVILAAFESMRGQGQLAITHIRSGTKILSDLAMRHHLMWNTVTPKDVNVLSEVECSCDMGRLNYPRGAEESIRIQDDVPQTLEMGLVAISLSKLSMLLGSAEEQEGKPVPKFAASLPSKFPECPSSFKSLDEARGTLFAIMDAARGVVYYHQEQNRQGRTTGPDDGIARCALLDTQLQRWAEALEKLLQRTEEEAEKDKSTPAESSEILLMQAWRKYASIRMWITMLPSQPSLDLLEPDLEELLDLCERCLGMMAKQHAARLGRREHRAPVFVMDLGILPILFWIGRKRNPKRLRLRALRLTERTPKREALWDSETVKSAIVKSLEEDEESENSSFVDDPY